ncbi:cupin domain-containing protein [Streptomyces sp. NPDC090499]|uniref:cupin domain-containing protein n=1 Tax=Streptomyces sp. NPDC090499 TaxID=3365965 RepID=UPI0038084676
MTFSLPAGIGMSRVHVYSSEAPDGQCGGTPHMHLACTELYVALEGRGAAEFLTPDGLHRTELRPGDAVQFTPGTIHRLITGPEPETALRILVVMENGHLNEEGDVVFAFPDEDLADPERYAGLAAADTLEAARARRDHAVRGFTGLVDAWHASPDRGRERLLAFYRRAATLVRHRAAAWPRVVAEGPAGSLARLAARAEAVAAGDVSHLEQATVTELAAPRPASMTPRMCGTLWPYRPDGTAGTSRGTS